MMIRIAPIKSLAVFVLALLTTTVINCQKQRDNPLDSKSPDNLDLGVSYGRDGIQVDWNSIDNFNISGYNVHRSEDASRVEEIIYVSNALNTIFLDQDIWIDRTYFYRITAFEKDGAFSYPSRVDSAVTSGGRMKLSQNSIAASRTESSFHILISNDSTVAKFDWEATNSSPSWLTLSSTSGTTGDSLSFSILENGGTEPRVGDIVISSPLPQIHPETLTVTQDYQSENPILCLSDSLLQAPGLGGSSPTYSIVNCGNSVAVNFAVNSDASWIRLSLSTGNTPTFLSFDVDTNNTGFYREGHIVVLPDGFEVAPDTLLVRQNSIGWEGMVEGLESPVVTITSYGNSIVVGRSEIVAPNNIVNNIDSWDGSSWSSNLYYQAIETSNLSQILPYYSALIAAGITESGLAIWDGSDWIAFERGIIHSESLPDSIGLASCLFNFNSSLIVGGIFDSAGDYSFENIASWDGDWTDYFASSLIWTTGGFDGEISCLSSYRDQLVAGGKFINNNVGPVNHIAILQFWHPVGWRWLNLGDGIDGNVYALLEFDDKLIASGSFSTAGGTAVNNISAWDGSSWTTMGDGLGGASDRVYSLAVYNGKLYVGGDFSLSGSTVVNNIAVWKDNHWAPLIIDDINGVDGAVNVLYSSGPFLYVGGDFTSAGGSEVNHIAIWSDDIGE